MLRELLYDLKQLLYNKSMFVALLLLLILGFSFGYYFTEILNNKHKDDVIDIENKTIQLVDEDNENEMPVNFEKQDVEIESTTQITYEIEYLRSNDIEKEIAIPQEDIIGFNESEIQNHFIDWKIKNFDKDELILHKAIDSYSPRHYKIGIAIKEGQGYIAVFNFDKEGQEVIDFISDTPIAILNKIEQEKLHKGMIFDNIDQVHRMLENYDL